MVINIYRSHPTTAAAVVEFQRKTSPYWLGSDSNGSHLVNFPFAFTVFMILTTGLTVVGCGITVTSAWLAVVGFLITLLGCSLYGWSLYDD